MFMRLLEIKKSSFFWGKRSKDKLCSQILRIALILFYLAASVAVVFTLDSYFFKGQSIGLERVLVQSPNSVYYAGVAFITNASFLLGAMFAGVYGAFKLLSKHEWNLRPVAPFLALFIAIAIGNLAAYFLVDHVAKGTNGSFILQSSWKTAYIIAWQIILVYLVWITYYFAIYRRTKGHDLKFIKAQGYYIISLVAIGVLLAIGVGIFTGIVFHPSNRGNVLNLERNAVIIGFEQFGARIHESLYAFYTFLIIIGLVGLLSLSILPKLFMYKETRAILEDKTHIWALAYTIFLATFAYFSSIAFGEFKVNEFGATQQFASLWGMLVVGVILIGLYATANFAPFTSYLRSKYGFELLFGTVSLVWLFTICLSTFNDNQSENFKVLFIGAISTILIVGIFVFKNPQIVTYQKVILSIFLALIAFVLMINAYNHHLEMYALSRGGSRRSVDYDLPLLTKTYIPILIYFSTYLIVATSLKLSTVLKNKWIIGANKKENN